MATLEELVVSLVAETSGLRAELDKATKATKDATTKMDKAIEEFSKNSSKEMGFWQTTMATAVGFLGSQAVMGAFGLVKDAAGAMVGQLMEGAEAAIAEETAMKRLANSLALSGQYSETAMKGLQSFAGEMENTTGIADDVIAKNLAMLSSLTRLDAEGLKAAQKAAADFAAATGKDLETATQMVAKAVNGSTDSFKKMGITIEESKDKTQALNNVLGALNGQFGGAAAGATQTFGGALTKLNNAWGNLTEAFATTITQNPVVIAMIGEIAKIIEELTGATQGASVALQQGFASVLLGINQILGTVAMSLDTVFGGFTDKFAKSADALAQVQYAGEQAFDKIGLASAAATPSIENNTNAVRTLTAEQERQNTVIGEFAEGLAKRSEAIGANYEYELELQKLMLESKQITEDEYHAARLEILAAQQEQEWTIIDEAFKKKKISAQQYEDAKTALAQKQYLDSKKMETEHQKFQEELNKQRLANTQSTLGQIATLTQSNSKELAAIGKAAAITQATIDGILAVQKALSAFPPPFNFVAAALVGVAAAANVAKISGVGLNDGGTIAGGGANIDSIPASLTKGETVISRELTDKLDNFLNNPNSGEQRVVIELRTKEGFVEWIEAQVLERQAAGVSLLEA